MRDRTGDFVWYELYTSDQAGAKAFYAALTGWTLREWENAPMPYAMVEAGGIHIGGITGLADEQKAMGAPPHWLPYIETPDLAATVHKATELGGHIHPPPTDIPGTGRFSIIADPRGAVFAAYQHANPASGDPASGLGTIGWHELSTTDHTAALRFYTALFGWNATSAMDMGPEMGVYLMFGKGEVPLGGMMNMPEMPPSWLCYCSVPDLDRAATAITATGGTIINGPMDVPGDDRIVAFFDPQGAAFALMSSTRKG